MTNCSQTFNDQSDQYNKLTVIKASTYDEDIKESLTAINEVFKHLSNSFKKWGKDFKNFRSKLIHFRDEFGIIKRA